MLERVSRICQLKYFSIQVVVELVVLESGIVGVPFNSFFGKKKDLIRKSRQDPGAN